MLHFDAIPRQSVSPEIHSVWSIHCSMHKDYIVTVTEVSLSAAQLYGTVYQLSFAHRTFCWMFNETSKIFLFNLTNCNL